MTKNFLRIALVSRVLLLIGQCVFNHLIPDHNAGVFVSPYDQTKISLGDAVIEFLFGGFRRWDAQYYLHIAEHGYTYENTLAFYPLFPMFVNLFTNILLICLPWLSFRAGALVSAVFLNILFFCLAAYSLFNLTRLVFKDHKTAMTASYLFCINPASVFFTAPYSESLFAFVTFQTIYESARGNILLSLLPLIMSILCRSNGLINIGFVLYFGLWWLWKANNFDAKAKLIAKMILTVLLSAVVFISIQRYYFSLFCVKNAMKYSKEIINYASENNLILAGNSYGISSPWCRAKIPLAYSYVQSKYWDVGLFSYYEFKQIPNFILATPILFLFIKQLLQYYSNVWDMVKRIGLKQSFEMLFVDTSKTMSIWLVYVVHITFLTIVCVLFVHIQVSTRLLASSSPCLYWFCAAYIKDLANLHLTGKLILIWFFGYCLVGTIMFSNYLPWT